MHREVSYDVDNPEIHCYTFRIMKVSNTWNADIRHIGWDSYHFTLVHHYFFLDCQRFLIKSFSSLCRHICIIIGTETLFFYYIYLYVWTHRSAVCTCKLWASLHISIVTSTVIEQHVFRENGGGGVEHRGSHSAPGRALGLVHTQAQKQNYDQNYSLNIRVKKSFKVW